MNEAVTTLSIRTAGEYGKLSRDLLPALRQLKLSNTAAVREAATKAVEQIERE